MTTYDFSRLTLAQQELLTFQGWQPGCGRLQPREATARKLIERGLLVKHVRSDWHGGMVFEVATYDVPLAVHAAWCAHCAKKEARRG